MEEGAQGISTFVLGSVFSKANDTGVNAAEVIPRLKLAEFTRMVLEGTISRPIAKEVFDILWAEGGDPRAIVEARGLKQVTDTGAIEAIVDKIIADNPAKAAEVAAKPAMLGWFVGQAMKASGGKANPQAVNALLKEKLGL
jgi:aspartyl-tRNA(Asn)/glutamyl-tRNA(Gln) amidotransferase subunit B